MTHISEGSILNQRYKIIEFLNAGGFGCTYKAVSNLGKVVAIKEFFVKDFCNRDENTFSVSVGTISKKPLVEKLRRKFVEEAQIVNKLQHPSIVNVFDLFDDHDTSYYVMDFIDGPSLNQIVKAQGKLSEEKALHYIRQISDALDYVHKNNRLHLDIKPANIMVDSNDRAILIDFGASKQYDEVGGENTSSLMGKTPGYAPPEQMGNNVNTFLAATDIYALGATLVKLLTGVTPPNASERAGGEPLPELGPEISATTKMAIEKAMSLPKKMRPQSIPEFLDILDGKTQSEEQHISTPPPPPPPGDDTTIYGGENDIPEVPGDLPNPEEQNEPFGLSDGGEETAIGDIYTPQIPGFTPPPPPGNKKNKKNKKENNNNKKTGEEGPKKNKSVMKMVFVFLGAMILAGVITLICLKPGGGSTSPNPEAAPTDSVSDALYTNKLGVTFKYTGPVIRDRHGNFVPSGEGEGVYESSDENGTFISTYKGMYHDGLRAGKCQTENNRGGRFDGTYVDDHQDTGKYTVEGATPDESYYYVGSFDEHENLRNGTMYNMDGTIYSNYRNGVETVVHH